jgi:26S proteasome regulatory subunit N7
MSKDKKKSGQDGGGETIGNFAEEENAPKYPRMEIAQQMHRLSLQSKDELAKTMNNKLEMQVLEEIAVELENPSLYKLLRDEKLQLAAPLSTVAKLTADDLKAMEGRNAETVVTLEAAIEDAKESAGDMEVLDATVALAKFAAKSLGKDEALAAYDRVLNVPKLSSGKKIDAYMASARIASFYSDTGKADELIEHANKLASAGSGADWDRRNRLKIYVSLQRLLHRDTKKASELLLDCIATFSCTELCSYQEFIVYTVLTCLLHLPRQDLKAKILDGPEVLSVASDIPHVLALVSALHSCNYQAYLQAMVHVHDDLLQDRYLAPHASYWMRELHLMAYKQYLDSYQSVTLVAMASAFGVSVEFLDYHASRFIACGSLSAKIDKYGGVIVTQRPDGKNAEYREMIHQGDLLLNRIQKLARAVDL